jgi:hypothetical protein
VVHTWHFLNRYVLTSLQGHGTGSVSASYCAEYFGADTDSGGPSHAD